MPSKLKKAIGAVKDRTSIGLARVSRSATGGSSSSQIDLLVLKATTHDEVPVDERYVDEILLLTSSSKPNAATCVQAVSRRIDRTRNWVVALKCLHLVCRALQDGGPFFPREALSAMRRGARLLNLSSFQDESAKSSPWDYSAFVRTFALYLDERLDCALLGKLQNRRGAASGGIGDMKPPVILDRISYWQRLLDRAIATKPTGPARRNQLVHVSLYSVVREAFYLYRDVSDGLALLLDSFFQLQHRTCADAYHTCVRASRQFEELSEFYAHCQSVGVGRRSEYPTVQKISDALLRTLNDFVKVTKDSPSVKLKTMGPLQMLLLPPTSDEEGRNVSLSSKASVDGGCSPKGQQRSSVGSNGMTFDEMPAGADPRRTPRRTDSTVGRRLSISSDAASNAVAFDEMQVATTSSRTPRRSESHAGRRLSISSDAAPNAVPFDEMQMATTGSRTPRRSESYAGRRLSISSDASSNTMPFDEMQMATISSRTPRRSESYAGKRLSIDSDAAPNQALFDEMPTRAQCRTTKRSESYGGRQMPTILSAIPRTASFDEMPRGRGARDAGRLPTLSHLLSFRETPNGEWVALEEVDDQKERQQHTHLTLFDAMPNSVSSGSDGNEGQWPSAEPGKHSQRMSSTITDLVLFEDHPVPSTASCTDEWQLVLVETANTISAQMDRTPSYSHQPPAVAQKNPFLDDSSSLVAWEQMPSAAASTLPPPTFRADSSSNTSVVVWEPLEPASASPTFRADSSTDTTTLVVWDPAGPSLGTSPTFRADRSGSSSTGLVLWDPMEPPLASPTFRADGGSDWGPPVSSAHPPPTFRTESSSNWGPPLESSALQPPPTFRALMPGIASVASAGAADPFSSQLDSPSSPGWAVDVSAREMVLRQEQQIWLEQQSKIIASRNLPL